jgi:hypothetical protein
MSARPMDREDRFGAIVLFLRVCAALALGLAVVGTLAASSVADRVGDALVAVLVAVPFVRVTWLVIRWVNRGDRRFAIAGCALLAVWAAMAVVALV